MPRVEASTFTLGAAASQRPLPHALARFGAALALTAVCLGARFTVDPWLGDIQPFTLFYVAILGATALGGVGPGVLALLLAAPLAEYFFVQPRHSFGYLRPGSPSLLLLLVHFVVGGAIIALVEHFRRTRSRLAAAVAELGEANTLLSFSMEVADQGCIEWDADSGRVRLSPRAAVLHGVPDQREISLPDFEKLITHADGPPIHEAFQSALAQRDLRLDYRIDVAGQSRWLHIRARVWPGPQPRRVIGLVTDVTEERRLTAAMAHKHQLLEAVFSSADIGLCLADEHGHFTRVNPAFARMFEYSEHELIGVHYTRLVPLADRSRVEEIRQSHLSGTGAPREFPSLTKSGKLLYMRVSGSRIKTPDGGTMLLSAVADITEVKAAREALEGLNAELEGRVNERTARLNETITDLEAFSYSLAHDLRSPLIAMRGYADVLLESHLAQLDAEAQGYLRRISVGAHRLDELIRDVMNYNRVLRQEMPIVPVDVSRLVAEVIDRYPALNAQHAAISVADDLPCVLANHAGLSQALACLLDNAIKFVALGATPVVRVFATAGESPRLAARMPGRSVRILVQDNGIGIDPAYAHRLFKMFNRLHREGTYVGAGVGLAIARKAVERMGGEIGFSSQPGHGSCFWIELPFHAPAVNETASVRHTA